MKILGIETSCDETALSLLECDSDANSPTFNVVNTALDSQIDKHKEYGGVYPSLAKREHAKNIIPLLISLLDEKVEDGNTFSDEQVSKLKEIFSHEEDLFEIFIKVIPNIKKPDVDMIAVTYGPGLEPALWVGINFARALSYVWNIPVMPTNHMEGHIVSVLKDNKGEISFPIISLLISGGHTELVLIKAWGEYEVIGKTLDDAVGEAFDKVARLMDLPYPGGPEISKLAKVARDNNLSGEIELPRPMLNSGDYMFSFSGIKTAVLYLIKDLKENNKLDDEMKKIVALEFENAVTEVLYKKTKAALEEFNASRLIIGGGVIANTYIRETFNTLDAQVDVPEFNLATDNAVMIAMAGYIKSFREKPTVSPEIKAQGNLSL